MTFQCKYFQIGKNVLPHICIHFFLRKIRCKFMKYYKIQVKAHCYGSNVDNKRNSSHLFFQQQDFQLKCRYLTETDGGERNGAFMMFSLLLMPMLCLSDSLPSNQHIQDVVLLDIVHGLLVSHHSEVVAVQLKDLVMHPQPSRN